MNDIFLDKNENPFDIPDSIKYQLLEYIKKTKLNRYPEKGLPMLLEKIGDFLGVTGENIIAGNGSDELLSLIIGDVRGNIVINTPTFEMYSFYAKNFDYNTINIPLNDDFSINTDSIMSKKNAKLIILCSPNNPTGNIIKRSDVEKILDMNIPTVLDNAYFEFSGEEYIDLIDDYDNLIILRTFSKAFSMAGLRVGYGIANKNLAKKLKEKQSPFYLNLLSSKMAEIMIDNYSTVQEHLRYIIDERERVYRHIKELAYPSRANFLLLKRDIYDYMRKNGVYIRKLPFMDNSSRLTIGKREENDIAIKLIEDYIQS